MTREWRAVGQFAWRRIRGGVRKFRRMCLPPNSPIPQWRGCLTDFGALRYSASRSVFTDRQTFRGP